MALLAQADFEAMSDSVAAQIVEGLKEFDNDGSLGGSYTLGALANVTRAVGLGDAEQEASLIGPARASFNASKAYPLLYLPPRSLIVALAVHARSYNLNGVDGYLTSVGTRVAPEFNDAHFAAYGTYLSPANVWPPVIDTGDGLGKFVADGLGAGLFTDGVAIDATLYGGGQLYAEIIVDGTAPTVANWIFDITLTKADGSSETKVVTFPPGSTVGTQIDVGVHPADRYVDVTLIAMNAGDPGAMLNNDEIRIYSEPDRVIAL